MESIRVKNNLEVIEFDGELVSEASTERVNDPRWTEIKIYRTRAGQYVIHRIGRSVIFHRQDSECNFGVATPAAALPRDAEACGVCRPPAADDLEPSEIVDLELDLHSADVCDAAEVPRRLAHRRRDPHTGNDVSSMSSVSRRALATAISADRHLRDAVQNVRRVS